MSYAKKLINKWSPKYYNGGMIELKSKTGKSSKKGTGAGRPRKITINDLNESDREIYR